MLLLNESSLTVRAVGRIVKAETCAWLRDAECLLAATQTAIAQREQETKAAIQQAEAAGFAKGISAAAQTIAHLQAAWQAEQAAFRRQLQTRLREILADAVRNYMGLQPDDVVLDAQVRQAWAAIGQHQQRMTVRVPSGQGAICRESVQQWRRAFPALAQIDIQEDVALSPKSCMVGSESGWVTVDLETHFAALDEALQQAFRERSGK